MKGQAAMETLLIVGAILVVISALMVSGQRSSEVSTALAAARTGADEAIAKLDAQYGCQMSVYDLSFNNGTVTITINALATVPSSAVGLIENEVRTEALKHIYQAATGTFTENAQPVVAKYYRYDVSVVVTRVSK